MPTVSPSGRRPTGTSAETFDLVRRHFTGHPDLRRILLAEDWEGFPFREDYEFPLEYHGIRVGSRYFTAFRTASLSTS